MNEYVIFTDSCCDIKPGLLEQWGVPYANMTFTFDGEGKEYINADITNKEFYDRMRKGASAKTAAINADSFACAFEPILQEGKDILYIAFSSGLSTTVNSAHMAAEELKEKYPDRKIAIVDTLAASAGGGLMVYMAVAKKNEGASLEENAAYIASLIPQHCIWFTVDDLEYLKRVESALWLPLQAACLESSRCCRWTMKVILSRCPLPVAERKQLKPWQISMQNCLMRRRIHPSLFPMQNARRMLSTLRIC